MDFSAEESVATAKVLHGKIGSWAGIFIPKRFALKTLGKGMNFVSKKGKGL